MSKRKYFFDEGNVHMRATGIVRRIDDLGRIVIPKEIRKVLKIREGEALEIFTAKNNEIILKKYSPMGELNKLAQDYAETLSETLNKGILITDRDAIISVSNLSKKEYKDKDISYDLDDVLHDRAYTKIQGNDMIPLIRHDSLEYTEQIIVPLISLSGECVGSIIMVSNDTTLLTEEDEKILKVAASFLGKQVQ